MGTGVLSCLSCGLDDRKGNKLSPKPEEKVVVKKSAAPDPPPMSESKAAARKQAIHHPQSRHMGGKYLQLEARLDILERGYQKMGIKLNALEEDLKQQKDNLVTLIDTLAEE